MSIGIKMIRIYKIMKPWNKDPYIKMIKNGPQGVLVTQFWTTFLASTVAHRLWAPPVEHRAVAAARAMGLRDLKRCRGRGDSSTVEHRGGVSVWKIVEKMMAKQNDARKSSSKSVFTWLVRKKTYKKYLSKQAAEAGGPWNRQWGQQQTSFKSSDGHVALPTMLMMVVIMMIVWYIQHLKVVRIIYSASQSCQKHHFQSFSVSSSHSSHWL